MSHKNKHTDDLEYLSQLGFEATGAGEADLNDLKQKVRTRYFSSSNSTRAGMIGLLTGILLGIAVFYILNRKSEPTPLAEKSIQPLVANAGSSPAEIVLDTITVMHENFVKPATKKSANDATTKAKEAAPKDTFEIIESRPVDLSPLQQQSIKEEKLKYVINSPVFYIHDLKVSDYRILYFKKNNFVRLESIPADKENKEENNQQASSLKQSADYYLHEELAQAMLYFKARKYDLCITTLNSVNSFNGGDINCDFYLGMCYYYKKDFKKAIPLFERCIKNMNNAFMQEALFYKAVSIYESGNKTASFPLFTQIEQEGEFYSRQAKEYLEKAK